MSSLVERDGWWYLWISENGKRRKKSLKTQDKNIAKRLQSIHDARMAVGKAGIGPVRIALKSAMEDFIAFKASTIRENTLLRIRQYFRWWSEFLSSEGIRDHLDLDHTAVSRFIIFRKKANASEKTIHDEIATMKACLRFAATSSRTGSINFDAWPKISKRAKKSEALGFYSPEDLTAIREYLLSSPFEHDRDFLRVFTFALCTGCRYGEIREIRIRDIKSKQGVIVVQNLKTSRSAGDSTRTIDIHPDLLPVISSAIEGRQPDNFLFPFMRDRGYNWCRVTMRRVCRETGVQYRRFHGLRHTFVTLALASGLSIRETMDLAGHENIGTTQKYSHAAQALQKRAARINFNP